MNFKELSKGAQIFLIIISDKISVKAGEVSTIGAPRFEMLRTQLGGVNVIDFAAVVDGREINFVIPENNNGVLKTERGDILTADTATLTAELKKLQMQTDQAITDGKKAECRRDSIAGLLAAYDNEYKAKRAADLRMDKIENGLNKLNDLFSEFLKANGNKRNNNINN